MGGGSHVAGLSLCCGILYRRSDQIFDRLSQAAILTAMPLTHIPVAHRRDGGATALGPKLGRSRKLSGGNSQGLPDRALALTLVKGALNHPRGTLMLACYDWYGPDGACLGGQGN